MEHHGNNKNADELYRCFTNECNEFSITIITKNNKNFFSLLIYNGTLCLLLSDNFLSY